jgi:hypothetical protein
MAIPFRECLRPEIEALAREHAHHRILIGEDPDPFADWVEAEREILRSHAASPARLMPGGDLFPYEDEEPN